LKLDFKKDSLVLSGRIEEMQLPELQMALQDSRHRRNYLGSERIFLDTKGIERITSSGLRGLLNAVVVAEAPPIVHSVLGFEILQECSLVAFLRPCDAVLQLELPLLGAKGVLKRVMTLGKEIPHLNTYQGFDPKFEIDGQLYELDLEPESTLGPLSVTARLA
jgi:ABC-type transporter Mla MlaB component